MIHFANWKVTSWKRTVTDNNGSYDNNENHDTNNWLVVASGRTRRLVISCVFCVKWVRWGVGGWVGGGMLTFIGLAHLRDATLLGGMLTFIGLAHLRDATLLHVLFNLHNYVMLRYCTFASLGWGVGGWDVNVHWTCTLTWCYATARSLQFTQLRDATLLHVLWIFFSNLHRKVKTLVGSEMNPSLRRRYFQYVWRCNLQTCTPLVMLKELAKLVKNNDADNC